MPRRSPLREFATVASAEICDLRDRVRSLESDRNGLREQLRWYGARLDEWRGRADAYEEPARVEMRRRLVAVLARRRG